MARRKRDDEPGAWHHVMVRGIAHRPVFENRADVRYFKSRLARSCRRGEIEAHKYCVMTNHAHLLVRSLRGELSRAMQRILGEYAAWFNRKRQRDGSLFKRPFLSRRVKTLAYRKMVAAYIDDNPVEAGIVAVPSDYPYGCAHAYATPKGPIWLTRTWVESVVMNGAKPYQPKLYPGPFPRRLSPELQEWVRGRLEARVASPADELDDLLESAPHDIRAWMERNAQLADGVPLGLPTALPSAVQAAVDDRRSSWPPWELRRGVRQVRVDPWGLVLAGLLCDVAGLTQQQAAERLRIPRTTLQTRLCAHRETMRGDAAYADRCARIAHDALSLTREAGCAP